MSTPTVFNHASKPLTGACLPAGVAFHMAWPELEGALRRAGLVRPAETLQTIVVGESGLWLVTEGNR